jgi:hypothetical protein
MQHVRRGTELDGRDRLYLARTPAAALKVATAICEVNTVPNAGRWGCEVMQISPWDKNRRWMLEHLLQRLNHRRCIITVHETMIERG